jgi:UDP-N-acetylglucosamine 1-carboxyvinyltransferase
MDRLLVTGGTPLEGAVEIAGAKNSALKLMAAVVLADGRSIVRNVPRIQDCFTMVEVLEHLGVGCSWTGDALVLETTDVRPIETPYELVSRMRASILVLGPLLARFGNARVAMPGGCNIGSRAIDLHIRGLEKMGARFFSEHGFLVGETTGLRGAVVNLDFPSVGATENVLMAAVAARGTTVIENAAREPEVADLASCLKKMGARIGGIGSSTLQVQGVERLHGAEHTVLPDRIETGTYAMAAAMTGGEVLLQNTRADLLKRALDLLHSSGVEIEETPSGLRVARNGGGLSPVAVDTEPFPGFPTDLQAQLIALMCVAQGTSTVRETIFENRFMHVQELARLGARIDLRGDTAMVTGVKGLTGAQVMATDLRASVSLIIAGLAAQGETLIGRVYHLDRGFERIEEKLRQCGAHIERLSS